jgi:hypothetical protein
MRAGLPITLLIQDHSDPRCLKQSSQRYILYAKLGLYLDDVLLSSTGCIDPRDRP